MCWYLESNESNGAEHEKGNQDKNGEPEQDTPGKRRVHIIIDHHTEAVHAMSQRDGQEQPIVETPERIGVAGRDEIVSCARDIVSPVHNDQMDNDKEEQYDAGDTEIVP